MMNLPAKTGHIMMLCGEPSGDLHAGRLAEQIKVIRPGITISAIGGKNLEKQGADIFFPISRLSAMGITEVIFQLKHIKEAFSCFKNKLASRPPDLIILIDYPGFNLKAAQYVKSRYNIKIFYYIPPKVWAWKKSRLKKIKQYVDHAALIFPFEEKIYKKARIPATYVGNPLVDEYPVSLLQQLRQNKSKTDTKKRITIGLLPGSRKAEINNLMPPMLQAALKIDRQIGPVRFLVSNAASVSPPLIKEKLHSHAAGSSLFEIIAGPVKQILIKSDLVIAASGTVTLEAALCGVPTILIYRMSPVSFLVAKLLVKLKFAGLANIIAGIEIMPELLQYNATPQQIYRRALEVIQNLNAYQERLKIVRRLLGSKGAAKRAAQIAIRLSGI